MEEGLRLRSGGMLVGRLAWRGERLAGGLLKVAGLPGGRFVQTKAVRSRLAALD